MCLLRAQAADAKEHIRRNTHPQGDNNPNAPVQNIVVGERLRPRMATDKVKKQEFECNRQRHPQQTDGDGLAACGDRTEAEKGPDDASQEQNTGDGGKLMGGKLAQVFALGQIAHSAIAYRNEQHREPRGKVLP